jgi:Right handed beta helix region
MGLLTLPATASAAVSPGCEEPAPKPGARNFYVDPAHGSAQGDGSQAHPWRTLQEVVQNGLFASTKRAGGFSLDSPAAVVGQTAGALVAANRGAPIRGGDTVYLMSGDHGVVTLQGANGDFITITAAPGQTPVLRQLKISGASKWVFRGLTFESLNTDPVPIVAREYYGVKEYFLVSLLPLHDNIVLDHNHFLSAPDVGGWTIGDWVKNRVSGIKDYKGSCIALTNNTIENIGFGIQTQSSSKVLIQGNVIDHFADDGIDYASNELLIANNRVTNSIEDGDGEHRDAMQGEPVPSDPVVTDVTIRDNTVIRVLDPSLRFPGYLQGIDTFDGVWRNVKVTGNVVITDALHGISYYGTHGLEISNNLLLGDNGKMLPCGHITFDECLQKTVITDVSMTPRIVAHSGKDGTPSSDVLITRNITTGVGVEPVTVGAQVTDNLCPTGNRNCLFGFPVNGVMLWLGKPGRYAGGNVMSDSRPSDLFVAFDPAHLKYDLHRRKSSGDVSKVGPNP